MRAFILAAVLLLTTVGTVAAETPEGPPSCDSSPEVYAECAALAGVTVPPVVVAPVIASVVAPIILPDTAMKVGDR